MRLQNKNGFTDFRVSTLNFSFFILFIIVNCGCTDNKRITKPDEGSLKIWTETGLKFDFDLRPKSVTMTDPDNIWICATSRTYVNPVPTLPVSVYFSHDGGTNWGYYSFEGSENCQSGYIASCDGNRAWIFIDNIGLMNTLDGGRKWENINDKYKFFKNSGLYFFDEKTGFALFNIDNPGWANDTLALLRTTDGGYNWNAIPSNEWEGVVPGESVSSENFNTVAHSGDTIGFATTAGRIFISKDKGLSWKVLKVHEEPVENLVSLCLIDSRRFSVVTNGSIRKSIDGPDFKPYYCVKIFTTRDGGKNWMPEKIIPAETASITSVPGTDSMLVVTKYQWADFQGGTYISTDGGNMFHQCDPQFNDIIGTVFSSNEYGFAVSFNKNGTYNSSDSRFFKWTVQDLTRLDVNMRDNVNIKSNKSSNKQAWEAFWAYSEVYFPCDIRFTDSLNVWMTLSTIPITSLSDSSSFHMEWVTRHDLPPLLLKSSDGGKTWTESIIKTSNPLGYFLFPLDSVTAFMTTDLDYLMKTCDGGKSWALIRQYPPPGLVPRDRILYFFDQDEGIMINQDPQGLRIWKTLNGGSDWIKVDQGRIEGKDMQGESINIRLQRPLAASGDTVAFATLYGRLWISYDRGINWRIMTCPDSPNEGYTGLVMMNSKRIILISYGLTVFEEENPIIDRFYYDTRLYITNDGGTTWETSSSVPNWCILSRIPGNDSILIATSYKQAIRGGSYISTDCGRSFMEIDTTYTNIMTSDFYSINHALGVTFNKLDLSMIDKTNFICRWNPEPLFRKGIIKK